MPTNSATAERQDRELRELRAELAITQTALADLAASVARREPNPEMFLAAWGARLLGLTHAAVQGTRPNSVFRGIERMVRWAEEYLGAKTKPAAESALVVRRCEDGRWIEGFPAA